MVLEKREEHKQNNDTGSLSHITHKNELEMNQRLTHKT